MLDFVVIISVIFIPFVFSFLYYHFLYLHPLSLYFFCLICYLQDNWERSFCVCHITEKRHYHSTKVNRSYLLKAIFTSSSKECVTCLHTAIKSIKSIISEEANDDTLTTMIIKTTMKVMITTMMIMIVSIRVVMIKIKIIITMIPMITIHRTTTEENKKNHIKICAPSALFHDNFKKIKSLRLNACLPDGIQHDDTTSKLEVSCVS